MGWDWTTSRAHLRFLETFGARPRAADDRPHWGVALGETTNAAATRLLASEAIVFARVPMDLHEHPVATLKDALRGIGAKVSGSKDVLVVRLLEASPETARSICPDHEGYVLTQRGAEIVRAFRAAVATEEAGAHAAVDAALGTGQYAEAYRLACVHRGADPIRRNALDPDAGKPTEEGSRDFLQLMTWLRAANPGILSFLSPADMQWAKWSAAHELLWGSSSIELPEEFNHGHLEDGEAAVRMLVFSVWHERRLASGLGTVARRWASEPVGDGRTCKACRAHAKTRAESPWALGEFPHPDCTSPIGCRCGPKPLRG